MSQLANIYKKLQTEWTRNLASSRFVQHPIRKFNKKLFVGDIEASYCAGALGLIEEIIRENNNNPYDTVDEMIGDLSIVHVELFNKYAGKNSMRKTTLDEDLVIKES